MFTKETSGAMISITRTSYLITTILALKILYFPLELIRHILVRAGGIEPPSQPWEGRILPLNHARLIILF